MIEGLLVYWLLTKDDKDSLLNAPLDTSVIETLFWAMIVCFGLFVGVMLYGYFVGFM